MNIPAIFDTIDGTTQRNAPALLVTAEGVTSKGKLRCAASVSHPQIKVNLFWPTSPTGHRQGDLSCPSHMRSEAFCHA